MTLKRALAKLRARRSAEEATRTGTAVGAEAVPANACEPQPLRSHPSPTLASEHCKQNLGHNWDQPEQPKSSSEAVGFSVRATQGRNSNKQNNPIPHLPRQPKASSAGKNFNRRATGGQAAELLRNSKHPPVSCRSTLKPKHKSPLNPS